MPDVCHWCHKVPQPGDTHSEGLCVGGTVPDNERVRANEDVAIPVTAEDVTVLMDSARRTADELRGHHEDSALRGYFLRVAGLLVAMRNALRAERERARKAEEALARLGRKMAECSWRGADIDGGDAQDWLVEAGVLVPTEVSESCRPDGEGCNCAEFGFPTTCYRLAARARESGGQG